MTLYTYKKAGTPAPEPDFPLPDPVPQVAPKPAVIKRLNPHLLPTITSVLGLFLILFVIWPIISYEFVGDQNSPPTTNSGLLIPLVDQATSFTAFAAAPKIVGSVDYTQASNWFPASPTGNNSPTTDADSYELSIPKLKIDTAKVIIGSEDLSKSLIHYAQTALPGQLGSPVIFGHSILPQFYNPKNYMSIFSTLPTLEKGDEIIINYDKVKYTYAVSEKLEVMPEDLWVLQQHYDAKKIKLITCVPPGLKTRRLVVTAELVQL